MQKQYPISEAKNNLPAIVHGVEKGPSVQLTRHGRPVAVIVSAKQYQKLVRPHKSFWDALHSFRQSIDPADLLTDNEDFANLRDQSPGRTIELEL